jgi:TetR/AcrR family transcriptional regulator
MDNSKNKMSTEQKILEAARYVFVQKGLDGARMQEIADKAGINKALLHYYFRSKEKLFNHIFENALAGVFEVINESIHEEGDVFAFIETFVDHYLTILKENPFIPNFIFNEISSHPDRIGKLRQKMKLNIPEFRQMVESNVRQKKIIAISPEHLIIDTLGLCVFPFVARPLLEDIFFKEHPAGAENFLFERKQHIISFLKTALKPQK